MVSISPTLEGKIERRARRAFRWHDEGETSRLHRITGVTKTSLKYRIPRSGRKTVEVVRAEDGVVIDPPTTGLIDVLTSDDIKKLKNSTGKNHAGEVIAYLRSDKQKKVGKTYKKADKLSSRQQCVGKIKVGQHVFVVEFAGADIQDVGLDHVEAVNFTITAELDAEKDLGFSTGLLDCLTKADVLKLKDGKHLGRVRAYKFTTKEGKSPYQTPALTYKAGEDYEIKDADTDPGSHCHKGVNVADVEWTKKSASGDSRVFSFEFDVDDIAAVPTSTDGKFRVKRCKCVEELDPKTFKPLPPPKRVVESGGRQTKKKGFLGKLFGSGDEE